MGFLRALQIQIVAHVVALGLELRPPCWILRLTVGTTSPSPIVRR